LRNADKEVREMAIHSLWLNPVGLTLIAVAAVTYLVVKVARNR
jgi:hypothetical protein